MFYSINLANNGFVVGYGYNETFVFTTWADVIKHLQVNELKAETESEEA